VVQWLQELIYLMEAERFVATQFTFAQADAHRVKAEVQGYEYEPEEREEEIKAATYHGMRVRHDANGWRTEVLFDL
jgi:SHS2 domain-containing protein